MYHRVLVWNRLALCEWSCESGTDRLWIARPLQVKVIQMKRWIGHCLLITLFKSLVYFCCCLITLPEQCWTVERLLFLVSRSWQITELGSAASVEHGSFFWCVEMWMYHELVENISGVYTNPTGSSLFLLCLLFEDCKVTFPRCSFDNAYISLLHGKRYVIC